MLYLLCLSIILFGIVQSVTLLMSMHMSSLFFYFILEIIGYCTVHSNIIQFNIDQSAGISANELSANIYWQYVHIQIVLAITKIAKCLFNEFVLVFCIVSGVAVCIAIISNHIFKQWLDTTLYIILILSN